MSLHGLDATAIQQAHDTIKTDGQGWFLLQYVSRDEVALLSAGTSSNDGLADVRKALEQYQESSPLFGLLQFQTKRVLLKYLPESTSRLLRARLAVHLQAVIEQFPHNTLLSIAEAAELTEASLLATTADDPPTASVSGPNGPLAPASNPENPPALASVTENSPVRQRLTGIVEAVNEVTEPNLSVHPRLQPSEALKTRGSSIASPRLESRLGTPPAAKETEAFPRASNLDDARISSLSPKRSSIDHHEGVDTPAPEMRHELQTPSIYAGSTRDLLLDPLSSHPRGEAPGSRPRTPSVGSTSLFAASSPSRWPRARQRKNSSTLSQASDRPSLEHRISSQSARPSINEASDPYRLPAKIKLGPRPAMEPPGLRITNETRRPVSSLPAGLRISSRPPRPATIRPQTSREATTAPSISEHSQGFSAVTTLTASPPRHIRPPSRAVSSIDVPTYTHYPDVHSAIAAPQPSPEKERLMKALHKRRTHRMGQPPTESSRVSLLPSAVIRETGLSPRPTSLYGTSGHSLSPNSKSTLNTKHDQAVDLGPQLVKPSAPEAISRHTLLPSEPRRHDSDSNLRPKTPEDAIIKDSSSLAPPSASEDVASSPLWQDEPARSSSKGPEDPPEQDSTPDKIHDEHNISPLEEQKISPLEYQRAEQGQASNNANADASQDTNAAGSPISSLSPSPSPKKDPMELQSPLLKSESQPGSLVDSSSTVNAPRHIDEADIPPPDEAEIRTTNEAEDQASAVDQSPTERASTAVASHQDAPSTAGPAENEPSIMTDSPTGLQLSRSSSNATPKPAEQNRLQNPAYEVEASTVNGTGTTSVDIATHGTTEPPQTPRRHALTAPLKGNDISDANSQSGDDYLEEIQTATFEEARPVTVAKSPATPFFPGGPRPSSIRVSSDGSKHQRATDKLVDERQSLSQSPAARIRALPQFAGESQPQLSTPFMASKRASLKPTKFSIGNSPSNDIKLANSSPPRPESSADSTPPKKSAVSSLISQRIRAFERFSSSPTSSPTPSPPVASSLVARRRSALFSPTTPEQQARVVPPAASYPTPSPSPHNPSFSRRSPGFQAKPTPQKAESVSVTATIIRDINDPAPGKPSDSVDSHRLSLHVSPITVQHHSAPLLTPTETTVAAVPATQSSSSPSLLLPQSPPIETTQESRRDSISSRRSISSRKGSSDTARPLSIASFDRSVSPDSEKKESKRRSFLKRMSTTFARRSIAQTISPTLPTQPILEQREPEPVVPVLTSTDLGDVNVQFPDSLLWKRRHVEIDSDGYLQLAPSLSERNVRQTSKRYHITDFKKPCLPDADREELPYSVVLDFLDNSTLQCACSCAPEQTEMLRTLQLAHQAFTRQPV